MPLSFTQSVVCWGSGGEGEEEGGRSCFGIVEERGRAGLGIGIVLRSTLVRGECFLNDDDDGERAGMDLQICRERGRKGAMFSLRTNALREHNCDSNAALEIETGRSLLF